MAGFKFTAQTVEEAQKEIYGPIIEMQCLIDLAYDVNRSSATESWMGLARGAMERMVESYQHYEQLLREQGHPVTCKPFPATKSTPEPYPCFTGVTNADAE